MTVRAETTSTSDDAGRKRRRVLALQRWFLNPQMRPMVWLGMVRGHALLETTGRTSGRRRRTVVGCHENDGVLWVIAEHGHHAGWVRNLEAGCALRVRRRLRWRDATAEVLDDDDAIARLATWGRPVHSRLVRSLGTDLRTVRITMRPAPVS